MSSRSPSRLLDYLPTIYRTDPFMGQFLLAFEKVLLGFQDDVNYPHPGLEESIANLATLFDPQQTPEQFLSWLAGWTALSLRADLPVTVQRDFVANIIQRYRFRGTKANLQELLSLFTRGKPTITETAMAEFQIGKCSSLGENTLLRGGPPYCFQVTIKLPQELAGDPQELERQLKIANAIIELEKPAHTDYELIPIFTSTMQIGIAAQLGIDTLLGTRPNH